MNLGRARLQETSGQLELPYGDAGEARGADGSGEALRATRGDERSGTERLVEEVVEKANLKAALKRVRQNFQQAETPGAFRDLDGWVRHRLRCLQLKQWKRGKTVYREMKARGASSDTAARVAANTRRWWRNSARLPNSVLTNRFFDELGVPRLAP